MAHKPDRCSQKGTIHDHTCYTTSNRFRLRVTMDYVRPEVRKANTKEQSYIQNASWQNPIQCIKIDDCKNGIDDINSR